MKIKMGRRERDGWLRLFPFTNELLAFAIEGGGGTAIPVRNMTIEQAEEMAKAILELTQEMRSTQTSAVEANTGATWEGAERRRAAVV